MDSADHRNLRATAVQEDGGGARIAQQVLIADRGYDAAPLAYRFVFRIEDRLGLVRCVVTERMDQTSAASLALTLDVNPASIVSTSSRSP